WLATVPLTSGLVADMFGPRWMSMLFGITFFSHQIGSFLGAWLGGYFYDMFQSYEIMWWISVALGLTSALLHALIRERRPAPAVTQAV
ncbi:MAG: MFS transporter, partial [Dichotomicrobium sp.]